MSSVLTQCRQGGELVKTEYELIDYALGFLNENLSKFEVTHLINKNKTLKDDSDFYNKRDKLRARLKKIQKAYKI